ncbi:Rha family transcriptional regulator [Kosakonia radicincitans]|uniref:Rha family transcriptional regulator n=1 Tax=Kosakonia radicincitans TaxID=283686 RepID=UPI0005C319D9|nr:Rha family transcriptional regulator [Kosakonia radicincitans]KIS42466.1 phage regulatory Rha family protein [Kosakonia radicincitans YD4]
MKLKGNPLAGEGKTHSEFGGNFISAIAEPTMSSLEMVDYINADRKAKAKAEGLPFPGKKYRKLSHDNLLKKVSKVLGENDCRKFLRQYKDSTGRELPCYQFPKREACLMAMSYSYELQAKVYDYMEELDRQAHGYLNCTVQELQDIVAGARKISDEDSSDAGRRLRQRQDDLVVLERAESLVQSLSQLKLDLIGGGKQLEVR